MKRPEPPYRPYELHEGVAFDDCEDAKLSDIIKWADDVGAPYDEVFISVAAGYSGDAGGISTWKEYLESKSSFEKRRKDYKAMMELYNAELEKEEIEKLENRLKALKEKYQ